MPPPLPRTKPSRPLPTFGSSLDSRPRIPQAQSLHSSQQQNPRLWQPPLVQKQSEQHDSSIAPYGYAISQQQGKVRVDTSSGLQRHPQGFQHHIESRNHFGHPGHAAQTRLDFNGYDTVSLAQLSIQSPDESDFRLSQRPTGDYSYTPQSRQQIPSQHPNSENGLSEQQREYYGLSPSGYIDQRPETMQRPAESCMQSAMSANTPQAILQDRNAIASSPFFKRGPPTFRPDIMQRPPARRSHAHLTAYDDGRATYPANASLSPNFAESRGSNRRSFLHQSHGPGNHQALYQHQYPQYRARATNHDQYRTMIPQTPRNSPGLLRRPDRPPSAVHRSPVKPESRSYNRRITLPPSTGPSMPMATTQDEVLSQIRGVRGVSSHRHIPGYQLAAPNHNVARTLFASGPRQSVRR